MKTGTPATNLSLVVLALGMCIAAYGQAPVIESLSKNGVLICTNLAPGTVASVEWAPSTSGPWTNNWAGLDSVTVDSNGRIQVAVPMFYRVRGTGAPAEMALVPAGAFVMGNWMPSEGSLSELPLHTVYVSAFYMDKYEVTKALWDEVYLWAVTNRYSFDNPGSWSGGTDRSKGPNHPVHSINWYDMVKWCNARSEKAGLTPGYYTDSSQTNVYRTGHLDLANDCVNWSSGYRLPTEAEWEKAARGGLIGQRFPWGDSISESQANYYAYPDPPNPGGHTYDLGPYTGFNTNYTGYWPYSSPVGSFAPNGYGLCDMAANVWEWCWDWYGNTYYSSSPSGDPQGPAQTLDRVLRGGSWSGYAHHARCSYRGYGNGPGLASIDVCFRCVRRL